ncbi:MAG: MotA/TolQ/ExbB proton channel family protein [Planctomycetaceae bacterium]|jgi:biopolymer transport protein ExbB|nr:MotA/TolQ/ExbB proton channel family protein [Planctomycetaceae bacterium]
MTRFACFTIIVFYFIFSVCAQSPPFPSDAAAPPESPVAEGYADNREKTSSVPSAETSDEPAQKDSFWTILRAGGAVGLMILLLSVVAVGLVIEYIVTIRLTVLVPPKTADAVFQSLQTGNRTKAIAVCQEQGGFLGNTILAGLSQPGANWNVIEKALEDTMDEQAGRLYRRVDYLALIGNISPMIGLLGTVVGMVITFRDLAMSDGFAHGANLAEGIYLALVTTAEGLIVAIPSLAAHMFFTNRVSNIVSDAAYTVEQIMRPVKQWAIQRELHDPAVPPKPPKG